MVRVTLFPVVVGSHCVPLVVVQYLYELIPDSGSVAVNVTTILAFVQSLAVGLNVVVLGTVVSIRLIGEGPQVLVFPALSLIVALHVVP